MTARPQTFAEANPAPSSDHRKNNFDLVRLAASLLVVVGHIEFPYFGHEVDWYGRLTNFQSSGGLGVAIFFVVSGYLVAQSRWRATSVTQFSLHRFLRIFPGLAGCILFLALAVWPISKLSFSEYFLSKQLGAFLLNMLVFPINTCVAPIGADYVYGCGLTGPTWSLTYEVVMYVFVGLIGFAARRIQLSAMIVLELVILALIMQDVLFSLGDWSISFSEINYFLFIPHRGLPFIGLFVLGSLLNFVPRVLLTHPASLLVASAIYIGSFKTNPPLHLFVQGITLPSIVLWFGLRRWRALVNFYERRIGDLSYGIFLYHFPMMTITWVLLHDKVPLHVLTTLFGFATFAAAYVSFHWLEKPALTLKARARRAKPEITFPPYGEDSVVSEG